MIDEDIKIYTPSAGRDKSSVRETDEVKIYTCSSDISEPEQSAQVP